VSTIPACVSAGVLTSSGVVMCVSGTAGGDASADTDTDADAGAGAGGKESTTFSFACALPF
jgi:hypothetical protein